MNKVILVGRLAKEPELHQTASGVSVCSFTVACDRRFQKEGEERQADIEIFISDDGVEWTRVFSGLSTGLTNELEYYDIGGVEARYVRVKGYKTTASAWVSITEFKVLELNR